MSSGGFWISPITSVQTLPSLAELLVVLVFSYADLVASILAPRSHFGAALPLRRRAPTSAPRSHFSLALPLQLRTPNLGSALQTFAAGDVVLLHSPRSILCSGVDYFVTLRFVLVKRISHFCSWLAPPTQTC